MERTEKKKQYLKKNSNNIHTTSTQQYNTLQYNTQYITMIFLLEIIDLIYTNASIDTKLALRKTFPNFLFTSKIKYSSTLAEELLNLYRRKVSLEEQKRKSQLHDFAIVFNYLRVMNGLSGIRYST